MNGLGKQRRTGLCDNPTGQGQDAPATDSFPKDRRSFRDRWGSLKFLSSRLRAFAGASAFSLVEIMVALGIFSFVIVAIMGTMTVALNSTRDSEMKLRAAHVGTAIMGCLKANATNTNIPPVFFPYGEYAKLTDLPGTVEFSNIFVDRQGLKVSSATDSNAAFRLAWRMTRDEEMTNLVYCYLDLTWPPGAASTNAKGSHRVASTILLPP